MGSPLRKKKKENKHFVRTRKKGNVTVPEAQRAKGGRYACGCEKKAGLRLSTKHEGAQKPAALYKAHPKMCPKEEGGKTVGEPHR